MTEAEKAELTKKLETWQRELPQELTSINCANQTAESHFCVNIIGILYRYGPLRYIHIKYHSQLIINSHHLILLHRPNCTDTNSEAFSAKSPAFSAASSVTRGIENLMMSDTLRQAQLHMYIHPAAPTLSNVTSIPTDHTPQNPQPLRRPSHPSPRYPQRGTRHTEEAR